ncbi:hypothetical protein ACRAWD_17535 [Caulobacter segnis]
MRFMVLLKVEADEGPDLTEAMRAYDAELVRAGVADRARLSARGARTAPDAAGEGRTLAGFWVFDVDIPRGPPQPGCAVVPRPRTISAEIEIRLLLAAGDLSERPDRATTRPVWERAMAF